MAPEVVTFGEAMLRLSVRPGDRLERAAAVDVHVAGAEANVAVALARIGRSVAWVSRLPDGPLGRRVSSELGAAGVDLSWVRHVPDSRLGTYFVELHAPPRPVGVVYDRRDSAASAMTPADIPDAVDSARLVHLSGITPALSDGCRDTAMAVADRARSGAPMLSIDVNYRAKLWGRDDARPCLLELASGADLLVCSAEDASHVFGLEGAPAELPVALGELTGARAVVVTLGEAGAAWAANGDVGVREAPPVTIIDRLGAGDALTAGVIDGLLDGDIAAGVERGIALASVALTTRGDQVVITRQELEMLVGGGSRGVDR